MLTWIDTGTPFVNWTVGSCTVEIVAARLPATPSGPMSSAPVEPATVRTVPIETSKSLAVIWRSSSTAEKTNVPLIA